MKHIPPKQVLKYCSILLGISVVLCLASMIIDTPVFSIMGIILVVASMVLRFIYYRCPHCGQYLDRSRGECCPHCGEKIE